MNRWPDEDDPADTFTGVDGDDVVGAWKLVCNGAGRDRALKLLLLEGKWCWSWLAFRLVEPGLMTSLTSASSRSMLSWDVSFVMMDISNSFSTWMPSLPSWTLARPAVPPVRAVDAVIPVDPVIAVCRLALRAREDITVMVLALWMGRPALPYLELPYLCVR